MGRKISNRFTRRRSAGKFTGGFRTMKHSARYFLKKGHK